MRCRPRAIVSSSRSDFADVPLNRSSRALLRFLRLPLRLFPLLDAQLEDFPLELNPAGGDLSLEVRPVARVGLGEGGLERLHFAVGCLRGDPDPRRVVRLGVDQAALVHILERDLLQPEPLEVGGELRVLEPLRLLARDREIAGVDDAEARRLRQLGAPLGDRQELGIEVLELFAQDFQVGGILPTEPGREQ